jgi:hypothetical protein
MLDALLEGEIKEETLWQELSLKNFVTRIYLF